MLVTETIEQLKLNVIRLIVTSLKHKGKLCLTQTNKK